MAVVLSKGALDVDLFMSRKRQRQHERDELQKILEDVKNAEDSEDDSAPEDPEEFEIERYGTISKLLEGDDRLNSQVETLWADATVTHMAINELPPSKKLKCTLKNAISDLDEELSAFAIIDSLRESTLAYVHKMARNRTGSNPRSTGSRCVGRLTCPAMPIAEEAFKVAVYKKAPARCCKFGRLGKHRSAKPHWADSASVRKGPARHVFEFETVLSQESVLPWKSVSGEHPTPEGRHDLIAALPRGYVSLHVSNQEATIFAEPDAAVCDLDIVEDFIQNGIHIGEWGVVIGTR
jgi:hypothetical protein